MAPSSPTLHEASLHPDRQVLILLSEGHDEGLDAFFGTLVRDPAAGLPDLSGKVVTLYGDLARAATLDLSAAAQVWALRDGASEALSSPWPTIRRGRLPMRVHGVGVYYQEFFDPQGQHFHQIQHEHQFQNLTESTKGYRAHRTGIYLTPVTPQGEDLHFHLLRCSTNLTGPSDNFRATDRAIVDALNQEAALLFRDAAPLNHVLAQIYHNTPADPGKKQTKARISPHADKTKDMPTNGVMAFCTFYEGLHRSPDPLRGLTRLRFRLKNKTDTKDPELPLHFTVTLHPNSVFFMPLSTNRLYMHEISPSELDAEKLPTRMGYVVRCSNTEAIYRGGQTWLLKGGALQPLQPPTPEGMSALRFLYAEENRTTAHIDYGGRFLFSMNEGDYQAPIYQASDEFRSYTLQTPANLFAELLASAQLEEVGKGRQGAVLVVEDPARGVPIVRTTSSYTLPAQPFRAVHSALAQQIRALGALSGDFNNALFEAYTSAYASMGAHSDQAQDLDEGTEIALFSCYEHPDAPSRRLLVECKTPGGPSFAIALPHNSVVLFSADTNRRLRHRIVLDPAAGAGRWLGLTFRRSKTFVRYGDGAQLADGSKLTLADEAQRQTLLQLRRRENQETDFTWPSLNTTLSASDLRPPAAG